MHVGPLAESGAVAGKQTGSEVYDKKSPIWHMPSTCRAEHQSVWFSYLHYAKAELNQLYGRTKLNQLGLVGLYMVDH